MMIVLLLEATEATLSSKDETLSCQFIEEWVPKIVTRIEELEKQLGETKTLASMMEAELLEAQEKIKELE